MLRIGALILVAFVSWLYVACGNGGSTADVTPAPSVDLHIKAKNLKFDQKVLAAVANSEISLTFNNDDSGTLHNVAIYTDKGAKEEIWVSKLISGKKIESYTFTSPGPGTYYFRCDAHPDMNGTFVVQ
jgi:plastocyanin